MTIKELKDFLNTLPTEFDEYIVSIRSISDEFIVDSPIYSSIIDEENNELCVLDEENTQKFYTEIEKNEQETTKTN